MRALAILFALFALCGNALADEPLCTSQDLAALDRWEQWLVDERSTIDETSEEITRLHDLVAESATIREVTSFATTALEFVDAMQTIRKLALFARGALDLRRVKSLSNVKGNKVSVDEYGFKPPETLGRIVDSLLDVLELSPTDFVDRVLQGLYDDIRDKAAVATNIIIEVRARRIRLYTTMRERYLQTKAMCDEDAASRASANAGGVSVAPKPPQPSSLHSELMLAARAIAPLDTTQLASRPSTLAPPNALPRQAPVDLGAIDRAVHGSRSNAGSAAPNGGAAASGTAPPAPGRVDLGALDRMAGTAPALIDPVQAPATQRKPSQDAYLEACLGKEKTAACHRAHCLHVGAALNDKKWTNDCLRGK